MKKKDFLLAGLATITLAVVAAYTIRKVNIRRKLKKASDEGYETAHDILFPQKQIASKNLRFGPILPE